MNHSDCVIRKQLGKVAAAATLVLMGAVNLSKILLGTEYAGRWLSAPEVYFVAPIPMLTGIVAIALMRALGTERHSKPFCFVLSLFWLGMAGLGITMWPYVVPPSITIWDAAAPERCQIFMLVGVAVTLPLIPA